MKVLVTSLGNFTVRTPTVEDMLCVAWMMRDLAKKSCLNPVEWVAATCSHINPIFLAEALKQAVQLGSGGGAEPTAALQEEQYQTEEGLAMRLHYHVTRTYPDFTLELARSIVKQDGRWVIATKLEEALQDPKLDAKKNEQQTGTPQS